MQSPIKGDSAHPFQLVKFLSWSVLILTLISSLFLSVFIGNYARSTVLEKHQEFALLLAENLNHQIYQRFTLPTVLGFGRVQLKQKEQYERLSQVILSTIHSFHVLELKIYDNEGQVSYSTDKSQLGSSESETDGIRLAVDKGQHSFEVISSISNWMAMCKFRLPANTFTLKAYYPLRAEGSLAQPDQPGPLMGVLEFSQDITSDYATVIHFQWLVILATFSSSFLIFLILFFLIRRTDKVFAERIREKEKLERELLQNEKLASMGRMVASIAHEIRNPLGIIRSTAELLFKKAQREQTKNIRLLEAIYEESKRLSQTVNDFLDYARPKNPRLSEIELDKIFNRILIFLGPELEKRQVKLNINIPSILIQGDQDLLYRAFYNLISNAYQAIENNGYIDITVKEIANKVIINITDSGPGFDLNMLDKYLEPFYTTKDSGTGLGLAIVNNIFASHNAIMKIGNTDDGGGKITIIFLTT